MNVFSVFVKSSRAFLRKILCAYDVDVQCSIQVMWYEKIEKLKKEYICALQSTVHHGKMCTIVVGIHILIRFVK